LQQRRDFQTIAESIDVDQLWQRIQALPSDWMTVAALKSFAECLDRLSNAKLLQNLLDAMLDALQRTGEFERNKQQNGRKPPKKVLCLRVQAAGVEQRLIASRAVHHSACA
jgi:hypothetical protein